jgi:pimeloyl-ACP methyl ester carboxylesterase
MIRKSFLGAVSVFVLAVGCASAEEVSSSDANVSVDEVGDGVWGDCPLHFDEPNGPRAECATFRVPLKWNADGTKSQDDRTIAIFAQRFRGKGKGKHKQLWMLQGGPGAPGSFFSHDMEHLAALDEDVDFYTLDHRGMGRSERIGCPQEDLSSEGGFTITDGERAACDAAVEKKWGHDLGAFSTTFAARDLHRLIERTRAPQQKVYVYGVSYGTHFAHRYLSSIRPSRAG